MPTSVMQSTDAVTDVDLPSYLASKGITSYRSARDEFSIHCLFCGNPGQDKGKGKMYLNGESWLWSCFKCGAKGNRKTLLEFFGDEDGLTYVESQNPMLRREIYTHAAEQAHDMLLGNEAICQMLLDRGIREEFILSAKLGYVPKNVGLSEMLRHEHGYTYKDLIATGMTSTSGRETFNDSIVIPYWNHGTVIQLRSKELRFVKGGDIPKYQTLANDRSRIYNGDSLISATEALIVEGEFDTLSIRSELSRCGDRQLENLAVIGLAGAGSWPEELVEVLSRLDKVFIGFDPDETGKRFAAKLREEVGQRARIVRLPEDALEPDWSDLLSPRTPTNPHGGKTWRDIRDLLTEADLVGKRVFSVRDAATKWKTIRQESPGLKLGFQTLDAVIRPGLKPGQVMIPLAATGSGKTVLLSNIAYNTRDDGCLYVSLEMTASEVYEHFRRIWRFHNPAGTDEECFEALRKIQIVEQNRIKKGDLEGYIAEYGEIVGHKPKLVMVDYLQYFARGFPGASAYDRATDAIMEIKAVGKSEMIPFIVPSQVSRKGEPGRPLMLNDARDAGPIEETGDFVVSFFRPDMAITRDDPAPQSAPTGNANMQLLKSRHGGVGRVFNLRMSPMSLALVDQLDRVNAMKVTQEVSLANQGVHYDDYRKQVEAASGQDVINV